jgi:hypothetical protein
LTTARADARRERLSVAEPFVPAPVWAVLPLAGLVAISFPLLHVVRRESLVVEALLIGAVTAIVVSVLLIVRFLDHPYHEGPGRIEPTEISRTLAILAEDYAAPAPCDVRGSPRTRQAPLRAGELTDAASPDGERSAKVNGGFQAGPAGGSRGGHLRTACSSLL